MKNKIDETVRDYKQLEANNPEGLKQITKELTSSRFLVEVVHGITNNKDDNEKILQAVIGIFIMACMYRDNNPFDNILYKDKIQIVTSG